MAATKTTTKTTARKTTARKATTGKTTGTKAAGTKTASTTGAAATATKKTAKIPTINLPSGRFPSFPSIDFSKLPDLTAAFSKLPKLPSMPSMPSVDTDAVVSAAKDAGHVAIGFAVLALQKAQQGRRDLTKALNDQFGSESNKLSSQLTGQVQELVDMLEKRLTDLDSRFVAIESKLDSAVEDLEQRLPERAGAILGQAHEVAKAARKQVRDLIAKPAA